MAACSAITTGTAGAFLLTVLTGLTGLTGLTKPFGALSAGFRARVAKSATAALRQALTLGDLSDFTR